MHPWVRVVFVNEGTQVRNQGVLPSLAVFGGNEESPLQWCLSFRSTSTSHEYKRDCQQSGTKHSTKHGEVRVMSLAQAFRLQGVCLAGEERSDLKLVRHGLCLPLLPPIRPDSVGQICVQPWRDCRPPERKAETSGRLWQTVAAKGRQRQDG